MIRIDRTTCTAYRVELPGCAVEYLCDKGATLDTTSEVELWIEVGDQTGFDPLEWGVTGDGRIDALGRVAKELRSTLARINAPVVAQPGCEKRAHAYRWLCRLGFHWTPGHRASTDEVCDAFVRPAQASA